MSFRCSCNLHSSALKTESRLAFNASQLGCVRRGYAALLREKTVLHNRSEKVSS